MSDYYDRDYKISLLKNKIQQLIIQALRLHYPEQHFSIKEAFEFGKTFYLNSGGDYLPFPLSDYRDEAISFVKFLESKKNTQLCKLNIPISNQKKYNLL